MLQPGNLTIVQNGFGKFNYSTSAAPDEWAYTIPSSWEYIADTAISQVGINQIVKYIANDGNLYSLSFQNYILFSGDAFM